MTKISDKKDDIALEQKLLHAFETSTEQSIGTVGFVGTKQKKVLESMATLDKYLQNKTGA